MEINKKIVENNLEKLIKDGGGALMLEFVEFGGHHNNNPCVGLPFNYNDKGEIKDIGVSLGINGIFRIELYGDNKIPKMIGIYIRQRGEEIQYVNINKANNISEEVKEILIKTVEAYNQYSSLNFQ